MHNRIRVPVGMKENGEYKTSQISGNTDVERALNAAQTMYNSGFLAAHFPGWFNHPATAAEPKKELHPFSAVAEEWLDNYLPKKIEAGKVGKGTGGGYKSYLKHALEFFGDKAIEHIKHPDVQAMVFSLVKPKTEDWYAMETINRIVFVTNQVLNYAVIMGYLPTNPIIKRELINPSDKKDTREALSKEEYLYVRNMIPALNTELERLFMTLLAYLPYRKSEALGQRWEDVDFDHKLVHVTGTVIIEDGKAIYRKGKAKNKNSLREMATTNTFMDALSPYRQTEGFVLNMGGNHLTKYEVEALWKNIAKQIPLLAEKGITPHYFRHTYATHMYHETNDILGAAKQCGHVNGQITGRVYIHDDIEHRRSTVAQMEAALMENVSDFVQSGTMTGR